MLRPLHKMTVWWLRSAFIYISLSITGSLASEAAERLYADLTRNYSNIIRPVKNESDPVVVYFGLSISQLIAIDERDQVMTTSVWVKHEWKDLDLVWDPADYEGIKEIHIPSVEIWLPDILLYNNANGNYDVQFKVNAIVKYTGDVMWLPPAIYKSSCKIDIEYFPFDEQSCLMKFGPWTHDTMKIDMKAQSEIVDQEDYWPNGEWEIVESPAKKNEIKYPCCAEIYADVTFYFVLHRKPLFYIVTLVVPCLLISFLTILVFFLPSDAQEKITLSISILLALIVFLLLIPNIIPPTSTTLPLIGRYMLFTMVLVTLSITITVIVINLHFRNARTHEMSPLMRYLFLHLLPKVLCMPRPGKPFEHEKYKSARKMKKKFASAGLCGRFLGTSGDSKFLRSGAQYVIDTITPSLLEEIESRNRGLNSSDTSLPKECLEMLDCVEVIARHMQREDDENQISEDWRFVALVIDRVFLWVFSVMCLSGTLGIVLRAPMLWETASSHNTTNYTEPLVLERQTYYDFNPTTPSH
ncbi:neuronal acetylcholine receptor subunit beta-2-like [Diadema antillarum]|uniref:neuronal acetylcholine receptor subunit beta-2-like n=1 Tax=Diadema antillarum TaxID=105358 RepID=UPI003A85CC82